MMENTGQRHEPSSAQTNEDSCFNKLPEYALLEILRSLDVKSLCQIKQTCTTLHEFLNNNDLLWKRHCLALRSVCHEVDEDRAKGFTWQETLKLNYNKCITKQQWLDGHFSNIYSYSELPQNSMCQLSVQSWGEIMEAEFTRNTRQ